MLSEERLREIEWAATYLQNTKARKGCRCAGSCDECRAHRQAAEKLKPTTLLQLIAHIKALKNGSSIAATDNLCPNCGHVQNGPLGAFCAGCA